MLSINVGISPYSANAWAISMAGLFFNDQQICDHRAFCVALAKIAPSQMHRTSRPPARRILHVPAFGSEPELYLTGTRRGNH
jgi:hypothetical protein